MQTIESRFCPINTGDELASADFSAFYRRWDESRGNARVPHKSAIRPTEIQPQFLRQISIIGVENNATRFVVRLAGSGLQELGHVEMTGCVIDAQASEPAVLNASLDKLEHLQWCVDNRQPYCSGGAARWSGRDTLAQRMLVLPYAGDDGSVERLLTLSKLEFTGDPCQSCQASHCVHKVCPEKPDPSDLEHAARGP